MFKLKSYQELALNAVETFWTIVHLENRLQRFLRPLVKQTVGAKGNTLTLLAAALVSACAFRLVGEKLSLLRPRFAESMTHIAKQALPWCCG